MPRRPPTSANRRSLQSAFDAALTSEYSDMSAQLQVEVVPVSAATTVAILALDANFTDTLRTAVFTASAAKLFPGKSLTSTDVTDNLKESDFEMKSFKDKESFGRFF